MGASENFVETGLPSLSLSNLRLADLSPELFYLISSPYHMSLELVNKAEKTRIINIQNSIGGNGCHYVACYIVDQLLKMGLRLPSTSSIKSLISSITQEKAEEIAKKFEGSKELGDVIGWAIQNSREDSVFIPQ